jgi:hypothetical protein
MVARRYRLRMRPARGSAQHQDNGPAVTDLDDAGPSRASPYFITTTLALSARPDCASRTT